MVGGQQVPFPKFLFHPQDKTPNGTYWVVEKGYFYCVGDIYPLESSRSPSKDKWERTNVRHQATVAFRTTSEIFGQPLGRHSMASIIIRQLLS